MGANQEERKKTKGWWSFILGVLGFFCHGLTGIPAIILGYRQRKEYPCWQASVGIILGIISVALGIIFVAVVAYNVSGFLGAGTEETARMEMSLVQTVLITGMADNSVGSVTAGTVTPSDTTRTVYYPETVYHSGGSFQLEEYMHLPTHGSWTWDSTGIVTDGTYSGGGETCVYDYDGTPQWSCTTS